MLQRVGIQARLNAVPFGRHLQGGANNEFQFWMLGWTPGNFDITNPARELLGEGSFNWGKFNDQQMNDWAREIGTLAAAGSAPPAAVQAVLGALPGAAADGAAAPGAADLRRARHRGRLHDARAGRPGAPLRPHARQLSGTRDA
jgi:hypothetical protein